MKCRGVSALLTALLLFPQASAQAFEGKSADALLAALPLTLAPMTKMSLPPMEKSAPPNAFDIYGGALKRLNLRMKSKVTAQDLLERGRIYVLKSDFQPAIKDLTRAIGLKKDFDDAYKLRGYCYSSLDNFKGAEADYALYLKHKPKDISIWVSLGACYDKDKQAVKAIDAFDHAIALDPKESAFYAFKADVHGRANEFAKADACVDAGLKVDPKSRACLYERAYLKELHKDKDGALLEFDKLIAQFPDFIQARKERAIIYEDQGSYQKALNEYDALLELVTANTSKIVDGAVKKAEGTDIMGGAIAMSAAFAFYPEKIYFLRKRSEANRLLRHYDEAMNDADYAINLAPTNALGYMQRGYVEFSMERVDDSVKDFNKVLQLDPAEDTANWGRGFAYCLKGEYAKAAADFDKYSQTPTVDMYVRYCYVYRALMLKLGSDANSSKSSNSSALASLFTKAAERLKHTEWPYPFLDYLNGKISETELAATADTNDKQTELHCFLALDAMAEKKPAVAKEEFSWVLDKGNKDFFEYTLSAALIKKF